MHAQTGDRCVHRCTHTSKHGMDQSLLVSFSPCKPKLLEHAKEKQAKMTERRENAACCVCACLARGAPHEHPEQGLVRRIHRGAKMGKEPCEQPGKQCTHATRRIHTTHPTQAVQHRREISKTREKKEAGRVRQIPGRFLLHRFTSKCHTSHAHACTQRPR